MKQNGMERGEEKGKEHAEMERKDKKKGIQDVVTILDFGK